MAESNKTEKATPKRRRDERKKGRVVLSNDVVTVISIFTVFSVMYLWFPTIVREIWGFFQTCMTYMHTMTSEDLLQSTNELIVLAAITVGKCIGPMVGVAILAGVATTFFQTGMLVTTESLKPKLSKLNPIQGFKRLFSLKSLIETLKGMLKITMVVYICASYIAGMVDTYFAYLNAELLAATAHFLRETFYMIMQVGLAFAVLGAFDYLYQRWDYEREMRMTKQEIKDEYKQMEGDPKVKGKIRENQRKMAMSRMMQQVPQADVIIRNPTHVAVALRYDPEADNAPILLAKGLDELAMRIIDVAQEHNIAVVENVPLARAIYSDTELDQEIPPTLYGAVADVLVQLYRLNEKAGKPAKSKDSNG